MIVLMDYRGFDIDVRAVQVGSAWDAEIRIWRALSETRPHVEAITCRERTGRLAEERGAAYAERWVDRIVEWGHRVPDLATSMP
jgi:hypothetical protein